MLIDNKPLPTVETPEPIVGMPFESTPMPIVETAPIMSMPIDNTPKLP